MQRSDLDLLIRNWRCCRRKYYFFDSQKNFNNWSECGYILIRLGSDKHAPVPEFTVFKQVKIALLLIVVFDIKVRYKANHRIEFQQQAKVQIIYLQTRNPLYNSTRGLRKRKRFKIHFPFRLLRPTFLLLFKKKKLYKNVMKEKAIWLQGSCWTTSRLAP